MLVLYCELLFFLWSGHIVCASLVKREITCCDWRTSVACSKSNLAAVLFSSNKKPQDYVCNFLFLHYWRAHYLCWWPPMTALLCVLSSRHHDLGFCALTFAFCLLYWSRASQLCFVFLMYVFLVQRHCFFACLFYFWPFCLNWSSLRLHITMR